MLDFVQQFTLPYLVGLSRPTTLPRQTFLSAIIEANSTLLSAPVSLLRVSMYDALGRPLPRCPGSVSMLGFPQYRWLCAELRVSVAVSRQAESSGSNFVTDFRQLVVQHFVCGVTRPMDIQGLA